MIEPSKPQSRSQVRDLPYTGISIGWVWNATPSPAKNNRVEGNYIYGVMFVPPEPAELGAGRTMP